MASNNVVLRRPKFDLRFITETSEYQIKQETNNITNSTVTENIISMTTKNALEDDIAAFSFVISGRKEWDKILSENDMVYLSIEPNEQKPANPYSKTTPKSRTVIIGLISEVRIEGSFGDNTKMYRITGQSFQKAFANFELRTIRQAGHHNYGNVGWMDYHKTEGEVFTTSLYSKSAASVAHLVIARFKDYMKYNYKDTGGESNTLSDIFVDHVIYDFQSWRGFENLAVPLSISSFEGSLNQLIKEIAEPPFLEYFFEVANDKASGQKRVKMIIRRTPFDKEDWVKLDKHVITTAEVIGENFGRNDLDAYSIFNLVPDMESEDQSLANAVPWYNPNLVEKYGYKMLELTSKFHNYIGETESQKESVEAGGDAYENSNASIFSRKLYDWYANNPNFFSGDITVVGNPDYKVGNRLIYKNTKVDDIWEFYIESVEHTFSYETGYTTQIGVTRGLRVASEGSHGIRFNPPAGKSERFKGGYFGESSLKDIEEQAAQRAKEGLIEAMGQYSPMMMLPSGSGVFGRPAIGRITSDYGMRLHPIVKEWRMHTGVDLSRLDPSTGTETANSLAIRAAWGGQVLVTKRHSSYGNYILITHGDQNGHKDVSTLYAHLSRIDVKAGDRVAPGQKIGVMGTTGTSTGVHLHFEVRVGGKDVDPKEWVDFN